MMHYMQNMENLPGFVRLQTSYFIMHLKVQTYTQLIVKSIIAQLNTSTNQLETTHRICPSCYDIVQKIFFFDYDPKLKSKNYRLFCPQSTLK